MPRVLGNEQVCADDVGVVFVTQRCVQRAWSAGNDPVSGKDFSKRKEGTLAEAIHVDAVLETK